MAGDEIGRLAECSDAYVAAPESGSAPGADPRSGRVLVEICLLLFAPWSDDDVCTSCEPPEAEPGAGASPAPLLDTMSGIRANPKSARRMIDSPFRRTSTNRDLGQECERQYGVRRSSFGYVPMSSRPGVTNPSQGRMVDVTPIMQLCSKRSAKRSW